MSDFTRLKRIAKSLVPRWPASGEKNYSFEDARLIINDLGMKLSPEMLASLLSRTETLDDFLGSIYELEHKLKRPVVTELATIDPVLEPDVHVEGSKVAFSVKWREERLVFAEYDTE